MSDINSIEVREGWKKYYLIGFFFFAGFFTVLGITYYEQLKQSIDFVHGKRSFAKLAYFLPILYIPASCLFSYFDKRVKVRIDSEGIWSRRYGNIPWDDVSYINCTVMKMQTDGDIYKLHVRLKDTKERLDKEVTLKFLRMDKSFDEVRGVVEYYAGKYQIQDFGYENEM